MRRDYKEPRDGGVPSSSRLPRLRSPSGAVLDLRHDFGGEVVLLLLDALAHLEADEAGDAARRPA